MNKTVRPINNNNFRLTFFNFTNFFKNNFSSIISDLFYGSINNITQCSVCNHETYNIQCFNILIFPIERIIEFKRKFRSDCININDCFDYIQKPEYIGNKSFQCNNCNQFVNGALVNKIVTAPKILIIYLLRENNLNRLNIKFLIEENIDISNYVININDNKTPTYYELIGIVKYYIPINNVINHYFAFCKSFGNFKWYKYDDQIVNLSSFEDAKNIGAPCILFYSYIQK